MQLSMMPAIVLITLLLTGMAKVSSSLKCFVCTTAGLNHPECLNKQIEGKDELRDHKNPGDDKVDVCVSTCGTDAGQRYFSRYARSYKVSEKPSGCIAGIGPNAHDCVCDTDLCNGLTSDDVPDCPIKSDRGGDGTSAPGPSPSGSERVVRLPAHSLDYWILIMTTFVAK